MTTTDQDLLEAMSSGDKAALATLYERYSKPLHDFARRTVRDREAAADVVQNTFIKVWNHLQSKAPPEHAKAWIFSVARNEAIDEVRRSARAKPIGEADDTMAQLDAAPARSPEDAAIDAEFAGLVWSAASALNPNAYTLLDMHLRQELSLDEIGAALEMSSQNVYKNMSRMRESLEEAVADALLRENRAGCDDLAAVLARFDDTPELSPEARRAISKHVRSCDVCEESRARLTAPAALFARLAPVPLTTELAARMRGEIDKGVVGAEKTAAPRPAPRQNLLVGAGLVAAVVIVVFQLSQDGGSGPVDPGDAQSTTHVVGVGSQTSEVSVGWTRVESNGFSIVWDQDAGTLPDQTVDLSGDALETTSPSLAAGEWFFHLRTRLGDAWTSTIHLGPYVIEAAEEVPPPPTTSTTTTPTSTTITSVPEPDVAGTYELEMTYGSPSGDCGYPAFTDSVTIVLNPDGTATLSQAQHLSIGAWTIEDGVIRLELTLDNGFPETYTLESTDLGATFTGQSTYQDGVGCVTTYEITTG